jgi:membrane-associated protease RseP (regulator of RpoE activity)
MLKFHSSLVHAAQNEANIMSNERLTSAKASSESTLIAQLDEIQGLVNAEFDVEELVIEHGLPTFYVRSAANSKQAFARLFKKLTRMGLTPFMMERNARLLLRIAPKPRSKPSRPIINLVLLLVTIATVTATGYILSLDGKLVEFGLNPLVGAASFALALLGILGAHEMAHKFAANSHSMEASMPYFIPGPPPVPGLLLGIGTFGAVIVQKEIAPNRDALFDIGASGPIAGFILSVAVSIIGLAMSPTATVSPPPTGGLQTSLLFSLLVNVIVQGPGNVVYLHPVAFAGWIGMFVTLLNLLPTGMLDGGHTLRSIVNSNVARTVFTMLSVGVLVITQNLIMLIFVLFFSMYKHPGPLDDVSKLSSLRKLGAVVLIAIFVLCLFLPQWLISEIFGFLGL